MATRQGKSQAYSTSYTRIAQVTSSYTEPIGITDKKILEEITNEAIRR